MSGLVDDMHDMTRPDAPTIRLRADRFDAMTALIGCRTDQDRAQLIDVTPRTINRARAGVIGQQFMAKTVLALGAHAEKLAQYNLRPTLSELFEVVTTPTQRAA
jgi:hypothetical protein